MQQVNNIEMANSLGHSHLLDMDAIVIHKLKIDPLFVLEFRNNRFCMVATFDKFVDDTKTFFPLFFSEWNDVARCIVLLHLGFHDKQWHAQIVSDYKATDLYVANMINKLGIFKEYIDIKVLKFSRSQRNLMELEFKVIDELY